MTFIKDGKQDLGLHPRRGDIEKDIFEATFPLPPQVSRAFAFNFELPMISTSMLGMQKQLGAGMAVDFDLVYERGLHLGANRGANLFFDPATGYNKKPAVIGPPRRGHGSGMQLYGNGRGGSPPRP